MTADEEELVDQAVSLAMNQIDGSPVAQPPISQEASVAFYRAVADECCVGNVVRMIKGEPR